MKQNRWKSKVLWASIIAQVIVLLQITGALEAMKLDAGKINDVVAVILQMLATIGIINNPTDAEKF